jgi:tRNA modification GTPase
LLNALAGAARAVVSPVAGTTRDAIWADVVLARGVVRVVDVAGVGEGSGFGVQGSGEDGGIEGQMFAQAMREAGEGDVLVMVVDATESGEAVTVGRAADLVVRTKRDLVGVVGGAAPAVEVSARTGEGMSELRERLDALAFGAASAGSGLALNARHVRAIGEARAALGRAGEAVEAGAEVAAMELREALEALGGVLGRMSPDDVLGRVFSRFCIGK